MSTNMEFYETTMFGRWSQKLVRAMVDSNVMSGPPKVAIYITRQLFNGVTFLADKTH